MTDLNVRDSKPKIADRRISIATLRAERSARQTAAAKVVRLQQLSGKQNQLIISIGEKNAALSTENAVLSAENAALRTENAALRTRISDLEYDLERSGAYAGLGALSLRSRRLP